MSILVTVLPVYIERVVHLWGEPLNVSHGQAFLIGFFLFALDTVLCLANWYLQLAYINESGYPKRSKREKRAGELSSISSDTLLEKMFLWKLVIGAQRKTVLVFIAVFVNLINIVTYFLAFAGFILLCVFRSGGACELLFCPYLCFFTTAIIEFVPTFFLPSDRKRYRFRK